jgi:hypothetical protein
MSRPMQTLPEGYRQVFMIDLAANPTLAIVLNLAAFGVLLLTFGLLAIFASLAHPELGSAFLNLNLNLADVVIWLLLVATNTVIHEIIHGIFFWLFTRSRPVFGITLAYAYAAAPDWYIPGSQYWMIGLAPLLVIGAVGLWVIAFSPPAWWFGVAVVVAFNTGGAVGDIWVVYKLLRTSPLCLVKDTGHSIAFYQAERPGK